MKTLTARYHEFAWKSARQKLESQLGLQTNEVPIKIEQI